MSIKNVLPMPSISNLDKGRRVYANVMLVNAVIQNNSIVNELFTKLWLITVTMVLIHRYFIGLHNVQVFCLHFSTKNFWCCIIAESMIVKFSPLLRRSLLYHLSWSNNLIYIKKISRLKFNHKRIYRSILFIYFSKQIIE